MNASAQCPRGPYPVLLSDEPTLRALTVLLARFGMEICEHPPGAALPGSFWGAPEAGLKGNQLHVSADTPLHSALHEACHFVCMDPLRRARLDTDAGADALEECAVCFLQIVLADELPGISSARLMQDMDSWGYSFRLGSTRAWFLEDAEDARAWLQRHGLIDHRSRPTWRPRNT